MTPQSSYFPWPPVQQQQQHHIVTSRNEIVSYVPPQYIPPVPTRVSTRLHHPIEPIPHPPSNQQIDLPLADFNSTVPFTTTHS